MKDHPLIFSDRMILAILNGQKTQTRRVIRVPAGRSISDVQPRYAVGDRGWVRERYTVTSADDTVFAADYPANAQRRKMENIPPFDQVRWIPAHLMPRSRSRITLFLTDVRVERLQSISEADALAEGCVKGKLSGRVFETYGHLRFGGPAWANARDWYADLWDSLNEPRGFGWDTNPWVSPLTFTHAQANIDGRPILE